MNPARVLATGVSGPIGAALLPTLKASGARIVRLVRGQARSDQEVSWDLSKPLSPQAVSGFDAVIHLAGETIVGRWTTSKKARIRESRVAGTQHLAEALAKAPQPPRVFVSGSAIGFYGSRGDEPLREESAPGTDFLASVCREWEAAAQPAVAAGIRTVNIRTGIVLSSIGGALQKMLPPFRMGLGGKIGSGDQWMSWIDIDDVVGAIQHILSTDVVHGPVNLASPNPVTNSEFTRILGQALHRPTLFPMPAFAARLAFGEMADALLLSSQKVEPEKLMSTGYKFRYAGLRQALEHILHN